MRNYDESSVLRSLARKGVKKTTTFAGFPVLEIPKDNPDIGIGSWGKIDFLVHHKGYSWLFVKNKSANKNADNAHRVKEKAEEHKLTNKRK